MRYVRTSFRTSNGIWLTDADRVQPSCGWCTRNGQLCEYKERKKPGLRAGYGKELEQRLGEYFPSIRRAKNSLKLQIDWKKSSRPRPGSLKCISCKANPLWATRCLTTEDQSHTAPRQSLRPFTARVPEPHCISMSLHPQWPCRLDVQICRFPVLQRRRPRIWSQITCKMEVLPRQWAHYRPPNIQAIMTTLEMNHP